MFNEVKLNQTKDLFEDFAICKHCKGRGYLSKSMDDYFNVNVFNHFATSKNETCTFCKGTGQQQKIDYFKDYR